MRTFIISYHRFSIQRHLVLSDNAFFIVNYFFFYILTVTLIFRFIKTWLKNKFIKCHVTYNDTFFWIITILAYTSCPYILCVCMCMLFFDLFILSASLNIYYICLKYFEGNLESEIFCWKDQERSIKITKKIRKLISIYR